MINEKKKIISGSLDIIPGIIEWSVDLEDWEKVLRVVGTQINIEIIRNALRAHHIEIEEMPV